VVKPRLLDLFSCAGGAGVGYSRAGFDVYAVDIDPQQNNPFPFHQSDALRVLKALIAGDSVCFVHTNGDLEKLRLSDFLVAHASPPCQRYSISANAHEVEHPDLVEPTRELLIATGLVYVIENVEGAPLLEAMTLCGTEFGLRAHDIDGHPLALKRHRLFESNVWLMGAGGCSHDGTTWAGVYGGSRHRKPEHRDNPERRGGYVPARSVRAQLLGIDWMNDHEMAQSIPPSTPSTSATS
jgi:DNA (cytosine-5)-methyltransferase 1